MKNLIIIVILLFSVSLYSQDNDTSSLYEQVIEYYNLAREEYEQGDYIKSYEYSQMASDIIIQLDTDIFFRAVDSILIPLNEEVSDGLENIKLISNHTNELIKNDYNKALNMYSNAITYHNEIKSYDTENIDMAKRVFNIARNNYESTVIMIDYMNRKLEYYAILMEDKDDSLDTMVPKATDDGDEDLISNKPKPVILMAGIMFQYIVRNNIITVNSDVYTSISNDINSVSNYKNNNNDEMANQIVDKVIKEMGLIILRHDNIKLIRYANNGMKRATRINKSIDENEDYQNIIKMVNEANALYNDKDYEKSLYLLSKSIMSLQEDFNIFKKLPKTYTVVRRRNAIKTDSFWNISGYDFVYANTQLWDTLYKENRNKLRYKNNPRIISVASVFTIPSIIGEERQGLYNPRNMYIPITVYYYLDYEDEKEETNNGDITITEIIIIETNDDNIEPTESGIRVESIGSDELGKNDTSDQYEINEEDTMEDNVIIEKYTEEDNN